MTFRLLGSHHLWHSFPTVSTTSHFGNSNVQSYNPSEQAHWFGLFPFRSPLLRESIFLSLPLDTKMFQFSRCPPTTLCIHVVVIPRGIGFPHSEISGSKLTYSSPKHIGVCSVLHRLLLPRHPPCALHYLIVMKFL